MNGKRYSRQRELIYEALRQTEQHPTAEMIYQWLKPANPSLSLGTVYRNLNLLADEGAIRRMAFPVERYDAKTSPTLISAVTSAGRFTTCTFPTMRSWTGRHCWPAGTMSRAMRWFFTEFAQSANNFIDLFLKYDKM